MVDPISLPVQGPNSATNCVARTIIVGIGANLGDRLATLTRVGGLLPALGPVVAVASLYESDAVGPPQDRYWNTAVHLRSSATAPALVAALLAAATVVAAMAAAAPVAAAVADPSSPPAPPG